MYRATAASSIHTHTRTPDDLNVVCYTGQQDGCGGGDGAAGGHSRHSCLCGQPVWKPGGQAATHGVCASGTSQCLLPCFSKVLVPFLEDIHWHCSLCYRPKMWPLPWLRADLRMPSSSEESKYFPKEDILCSFSISLFYSDLWLE